MTLHPRHVCPRCRSRSFAVTVEELCEATNCVVDGEWAGTFAESAMPIRQAAYGKCAQCGHYWRFRSAYLDYSDDSALVGEAWR